MAGTTMVSVTPDVRIYNNNKDYHLLMQHWMDAGGTKEELEKLEIRPYTLVALTEIDGASFPEYDFRDDTIFPAKKLQDADAFLLNSVAMGYVSVPTGEDIAHQEVIHFNSVTDFTYQAANKVPQHKAIGVGYTLDWEIHNTNRQLQFSGQVLKHIPEHTTAGHYHYPEGVFHNFAKPTLFQGSQVMVMKPGRSPKSEIQSLPGDTDTQKTFGVAYARGLLIVNGAKALNKLFTKLENSNCIK